MRALAAQGARLALPVIMARDQPLHFAPGRPATGCCAGRSAFSSRRRAAGRIIPDIVLVPLAAFDRAGHRIGYGAGHYDRTLAHLRKAKPITAIGLAFAAQEIDAVPASAARRRARSMC